MKRTWPLIAAWLVLLAAALIMGAVALNLLQSDRELVEARALDAVRAHARTTGDNIALAVVEVKDRLAEGLRTIAPYSKAESLSSWRLDNPLIRNVFIWSEGAGLTLPPPDRPHSAEEASFIRRYSPLFKGVAQWKRPEPETVRQIRPVEEAEEVESSSSYLSKRTLLRSASKAPAKASAPAAVAAEMVMDEAEPPPPVGAVTWTTWYSDDSLHLLGWVEAGGERYGLEVEMIALISGILPQLPQAGPLPEGKGLAFALIDGMGRVLHQTGTIDVAQAGAPTVSAAIGSELPQWRVSVWVGDGALEGTGSGVVSGLLVAAVVAAIVFGGSLLLWQGYRSMTDAQRKTRFVSNVSHELKTPLTTIRMYAELLAEGRVEDEGKRERYYSVIVEESQRLTRLVNNVLDFGRLEQGRKKYALEELDLSTFVGEVMQTQALRFKDAGVEADIHLPDALVMVNGDRDSLQQIVLNLIDNGLKYGLAGGGGGGEGTGGGSVTVTVERVGQVASLTVADRGNGVPPGQREKIFEKFHRVDDTLTAATPGSGLGLSIARQLAQGMGGTLTCQPREGGGTLFELRLPVLEPTLEKTT